MVGHAPWLRLHALLDHQENGPPAAFISCMLERVLARTWVSVATPTTSTPGSIKSDRTVLHLAGGITLGPHVGNLLELESTLHRHRKVTGSAQKEHVPGIGEFEGETRDPFRSEPASLRPEPGELLTA